MLTKIALVLIHFYRRCISPYKGFSCAYRVHTGGASCSTHGLRVVSRFGARRGLALLRRRMKACGQVYRRHRKPPAPRSLPGPLRHQAGFCDVPCDIPCDSPCEAPSSVGEAFDCACDALDVFDLFERKEKKKDKA